MVSVFSGSPFQIVKRVAESLRVGLLLSPCASPMEAARSLSFVKLTF